MKTSKGELIKMRDDEILNAEKEQHEKTLYLNNYGKIKLNQGNQQGPDNLPNEDGKNQQDSYKPILQK